MGISKCPEMTRFAIQDHVGGSVDNVAAANRVLTRHTGDSMGDNRGRDLCISIPPPEYREENQAQKHVPSLTATCGNQGHKHLVKA